MKTQRTRLRRRRGGAEVLMIEDDEPLQEAPKRDYSKALARLTGESTERDYKQAFSKLTDDKPKPKTGFWAMANGIKDAVKYAFTADVSVDSDSVAGFIIDRVSSSDDSILDIINAIIVRTFPALKNSNISAIGETVLTVLKGVVPMICMVIKIFFPSYSLVAVALENIFKYSTDRPVREALNITYKTEQPKKETKQPKASTTKKKATPKTMDYDTNDDDDIIRQERARVAAAQKASTKKPNPKKSVVSDEQIEEEYRRYQEGLARFKREHYGLGAGTFSEGSVGGALFSLNKGFEKFVSVLISVVIFITKRVIYLFVLLYNYFYFINQDGYIYG